MENQIEIFKSIDDQIELQVNLTKETVWLSRHQISTLFDRDIKTIGKHISNVFREGELERISTVAKFATVQTEGKRMIEREIEFYNLDVIISVGYRVKSNRGTQFRQWATQRLKDYLVQGFAYNQKRLDELGRMVNLIEQTSKSDALQLREARGLLEILGNYAKSFVLLNKYDSRSLESVNLCENITYEIEYDEAKNAIAEFKQLLIAKNEASELFGNEKDEGFRSSLQSIVQTFEGQYLYPSIELQAAHLLYFVIKNHSFNDGNKRIGAFLFVWFLEKNKHLFKSTGELKINDNGLTAIALLVAQSKPEEKEIIIQLIVALIAESK
jgi:prophage maintenance system killer protein